jgi:hypothetical protein
MIEIAKAFDLPVFMSRVTMVGIENKSDRPSSVQRYRIEPLAIPRTLHFIPASALLPPSAAAASASRPEKDSRGDKDGHRPPVAKPRSIGRSLLQKQDRRQNRSQDRRKDRSQDQTQDHRQDPGQTRSRSGKRSTRRIPEQAAIDPWAALYPGWTVRVWTHAMLVAQWTRAARFPFRREGRADEEVETASGLSYVTQTGVLPAAVAELLTQRAAAPLDVSAPHGASGAAGGASAFDSSSGLSLDALGGLSDPDVQRLLRFSIVRDFGGVFVDLTAAATPLRSLEPLLAGIKAFAVHSLPVPLAAASDSAFNSNAAALSDAVIGAPSHAPLPSQSQAARATGTKPGDLKLGRRLAAEGMPQRAAPEKGDDAAVGMGAGMGSGAKQMQAPSPQPPSPSPSQHLQQQRRQRRAHRNLASDAVFGAVPDHAVLEQLTEKAQWFLLLRQQAGRMAAAAWAQGRWGSDTLASLPAPPTPLPAPLAPAGTAHVSASATSLVQRKDGSPNLFVSGVLADAGLTFEHGFRMFAHEIFFPDPLPLVAEDTMGRDDDISDGSEDNDGSEGSLVRDLNGDIKPQRNIAGMEKGTSESEEPIDRSIIAADVAFFRPFDQEEAAEEEEEEEAEEPEALDSAPGLHWGNGLQ